MSLFYFLSEFDFFHQPVTFFYKEHKSSSTYLSLLISTIFYSYITFSFITSDMIQKQQPIIVSQSLNLPHANPIHFTDSKHFSVSLTDMDNINLNDDSIFNIKMVYYHYENDELGVSQLKTSQSFNLEPCNLSHVDFDKGLFTKLALKDQKCLPTPEKTFTLEGQWDEQSIKLIRISLNLCKNDTYFNKCKTNEQIEEFFNGLKYFSIYYSSIATDLNDYREPIKKQFKNDYIVIDPAILKKTAVYLQTNEVITDSGFYLEDLSNEKDFLFESKETDFKFRKIDEPLCQFVLFASHKKQADSRRYMKLDDLFGNLSGVLSFFMFLCSYFLKSMNDLIVLLEIMNSLYIFPKTEKFPENNKMKVNCNFKNDGKRTSILKKNGSISMVANAFIKFLRLKKSDIYTLHVSFFQLFKDRLKELCKIKPDFRSILIKKTEKQYRKEMDSIEILKKLQEIDKLKRILLTEKQYELFNHLSKPMFPLNAVSVKGILPKMSVSFVPELYDEIKQENKDLVNKRLVKLFDNNLDSFKHNFSGANLNSK